MIFHNTTSVEAGAVFQSLFCREKCLFLACYVLVSRCRALDDYDLGFLCNRTEIFVTYVVDNRAH